MVINQPAVFRGIPTDHSSGALIDKMGLKGRWIGSAQVSNLHANFLINTGAATSMDVINLIDLIKKKLKITKELN